MEQITKIVQEIGNGGHIYLPKEIVGKKVVITLKEKTMEDIEGEIINILKPYLKYIKGIYLHGSYARKEQTPESDIDILVITDNIKIKKRINEYEVISATEKQIERTIENNAILILPILKEAKPILNQQLIEKYKRQKLTKKNTKWYIETTESSLAVSKAGLDFKDIEMMPNLIYPLIMRLKGLHHIKSLVYNEKYSNKQLIAYLVKEGINHYKIKQLYRMYAEKRDNKVISKHSLNYDDVNQLYNATYKYFQEVRLLWEKLK